MLRYFYQACLLTLLSNCHTDQPKPLKIPNSYNRDAYLEVSIPEYEIRSQLDLLIKEAQKGRTEGVSVSSNTLRQLFSAQPNLPTTQRYSPNPTASLTSSLRAVAPPTLPAHPTTKEVPLAGICSMLTASNPNNCWIKDFTPRYFIKSP
jgi:hypothetical protein